MNIEYGKPRWQKIADWVYGIWVAVLLGAIFVSLLIGQQAHAQATSDVVEKHGEWTYIQFASGKSEMKMYHAKEDSEIQLHMLAFCDKASFGITSSAYWFYHRHIHGRKAVLAMVDKLIADAQDGTMDRLDHRTHVEDEDGEGQGDHFAIHLPASSTHGAQIVLNLFKAACLAELPPDEDEREDA